jgi:hypothetical protein
MHLLNRLVVARFEMKGCREIATCVLGLKLEFEVQVLGFRVAVV